ncbi:hypothetical protein [Runella sp.]|uniref:hypothetical protein n=1 Tax=Runella sp. TaxID=1960881 RepID=UPI003D0F5FFC
MPHLSMLEYTEMILEKVSFQKELFRHELEKAITVLSISERAELKNYCYERFAQDHYQCLCQCFRSDNLNY